MIDMSYPGRGITILITGGARSGKSTLASTLAMKGPTPVRFLATGQATDPEMAARIERHRRDRSPDWRTFEVTTDVPAQFAQLCRDGGTVILDCLGGLITRWLAEVLPPLSPDAETYSAKVEERALAEITRRAVRLADLARTSPALVIIVTNEVGDGVVPPYPLGRLFSDFMGIANRILARRADRVYLVTAGLALELKASGLSHPVDGT